MAYVGGNCTTAYRSKEPYRTITEEDIPITSSGYLETITVPDAEKVQVEVEYDFTKNGSILAVTQGVHSNPNEPPDGPFDEIASYSSGARVFNYSGDTITIVSMMGANNSITINIYPIYDEAPEEIETEITTTCNIARSENVDENGSNKNDDGTERNYSNTYFVYQTFTIPDADKITIDLEYAFTEDTAELVVAEGFWLPGSEPTGDYRRFDTENDNISGHETFTFNSNTVTFSMSKKDDPILEDYNYGFYAKVYTVYSDKEEENTIPVEACSFGEKIGKYEEANNYKGGWIADESTGEYITYEQLVTGMEANKEYLAGRIININAYNPYAIVYDGNGATAGTMDGFVTVLTEPDATELGEYDFSLIAPNFKKDGYGFAGWSKDPITPGTDINTPEYESKIYGSNQQVTQDDILAEDFTDDNGRTAKLYAVWVPTVGTLQNWTGCSTMEQGQMIALTDNRDGNVYTVAKLADNNCWMTENLRLDSRAAITAENTDHPAKDFQLPGSNDRWCWEGTEECIDRPYINTNNTNIGGKNSLNQFLISTPGYIRDFRNIDPYESIGSNGDNYSWYAYGNYYNWNAATAGTGTYDIDASIEEKTEATGSICPIGWRLPKGDSSNGGFINLDIQMGGNGGAQYDPEIINNWLSFPSNFVYQGFLGNIGSDSSTRTIFRGYAGGYYSLRAVDDG